MEIRIDSEDPYNVVGEIQVKGPNVMQGYYKNEEATQQAFTDDGWLRTGDLGLVDPQDFVYIKGRSKNMLLGPSGQNIYPEEIEAILDGIPDPAGQFYRFNLAGSLLRAGTPAWKSNGSV